MNGIKALAYLASATVCLSLACSDVRDSDRIPSYEFYVDAMREDLSSEEVRIIRQALGNLDTVQVVAQILGGQGDITEEELVKHLRTHIERAIPALALTETNINANGVLLVTLDLTANPDNTIYGFLELELSRTVLILDTDYVTSAQIWRDVLALCEKGDPTKAILATIQLQTHKFSALWTLGNT